MTEEELQGRAEEKLRKVVREFIEVNPNTTFLSTWVYNINGVRYKAEFMVCKEGETE